VQELVPEQTQEEIIKEAKQEAQIFAQATAIDQLLERLKNVDPLKDNLADDEEIQVRSTDLMKMRCCAQPCLRSSIAPA
jgi:signal transducing adaptor molecule